MNTKIFAENVSENHSEAALAEILNFVKVSLGLFLRGAGKR